MEYLRHNFYIELQRLGIEAEMGPRGRLEEEAIGVSLGFFTPSLGVIDIKGEPIRWVNIRQDWPGFYPPWNNYTDYGVPDSRLGQNCPQIKIKNEFIETGKVLDLTWKGKNCDFGIISRLNSDAAIKRHLTANRQFISIVSWAENKCWLIITLLSENLSEDWNCYKAIAQRLLE